jgi:hypothetical protein
MFGGRNLGKMTHWSGNHHHTTTGPLPSNFSRLRAYTKTTRSCIFGAVQLAKSFFNHYHKSDQAVSQHENVVTPASRAKCSNVELVC